MENIGRKVKKENRNEDFHEMDSTYEALLRNILHKNTNQGTRTPKHESFDKDEEYQKKPNLSPSIPTNNMMSLFELSKKQKSDG